MEYLNIFCLVLISYPTVTETDQRYVNYAVVPSAENSRDAVICSRRSANNSYLAARVDDVTGACEGLMWDWGSAPVYDPGFTYLRKTKTVEIYEPSMKINGRVNWLIPGFLGNGGFIELFIKTPEETDWTSYSIDIVDRLDEEFQVYDDVEEVYLAHIMFQRNTNLFAVKTWTINMWINRLLSTLPFTEGSTHKITISFFNEMLQVLLDDIMVTEYTQPTDPATAKQIIFSSCGGTMELDNLTVVGI